MLNEVISAISTPSGRGGVGIIRLSGDNPLEIAKKMFIPTGKTKVENFEPYRLYPGKIVTDAFTDYGMCVYFKAPKSYTGENVIEFHCHGGVAITQGILKQTFSLGARPAERGEYTKRAFLNGKMSLASAEGVIDMINGESEAEVKAGFMLYSEKLTKQVKDMQQEVKNVLAGIDADMDYPEEDIEVQRENEIRCALQRVYVQTCGLLNTYHTGKKIKNGVTVAICGKPNTGKSSLLNALLGYDKAIVSSTAGTTRDAVEGSIDIEGIRFNFYDTAGIRESGDKIEKIGIERAEGIIQSADTVIFVADSSEKFDEEDGKILEKIKDKDLITVLNKIDLTQDETLTDADVKLSTKTGEGLNALKQLLIQKNIGNYATDGAFLIEQRHFLALQKAKEYLQKTIKEVGIVPLDLLASDVKMSWDYLGEISGETATEAIVEEIFSKFCVGK